MKLPYHSAEASALSMRWRVLLSLATVVFAYLTLGGVAFHYLEEEAEKDHHIYLENITREFLEDNPCVTAAELDALLKIILFAYDRGVMEFSNHSSASNWDLASSLFFSITVVTTIGYGHIYPATVGGQAFCVIYAIFGIPLSLTLLGGIGNKLRQLFLLIDRKLDKCTTYPESSKVFRVILILLIGLLCFLFLPAIMFVMVDSWTYAQALYYCFITLTTIGFGDLVPGLQDTDKNRSLYRIMVGVWIFVGLAWLAGVITFVQELFLSLVRKAQKNIDKRENKHLSRHGECSSPEPQQEMSGREDPDEASKQRDIDQDSNDPPPEYECDRLQELNDQDLTQLNPENNDDTSATNT